MSRIGKQPVPVPSGVKVEIKGGTVYVQGPKGKLERKLPDGIEVTLGKTKPPVITITGPDKEKVGQFAAAARKVRPPSPYSDNKGIRYQGEQVRKKVGKAFGSAAK